MIIPKATDVEIQKALAELGSWTVESGKLHREYRFRDFVQAFGFMTQLRCWPNAQPIIRSGSTSTTRSWST